MTRSFEFPIGTRSGLLTQRPEADAIGRSRGYHGPP